jgi:hypothetical protein
MDLKHAGLTVVLTLGCLAAGAPARAQTAVTQASDDAQKAARAAYAQGVQAFERAAYAQALEHFDAADAAVSSPNVKLMRARCLAKLDKLVDAYAMFTATIAEATASGDPRYQASKDAAADEARDIEPKIALVTLNVRDESGDAVLAINDQEWPRERWGEPVPLAPGATTFTLTTPDGREDRVERTLVAGARDALALQVTPGATEPEPPVAATPSPAPRAEHSVARRDDGLPVFPIVLGAAGGAGLVAFAVFGAMSNGELATLERECPTQRDCDPELAEVASRGRAYQTIANVSLGAGLLLLAAGVTLFVIDLPSDDLEVAVTPQGAQLRGAL